MYNLGLLEIQKQLYSQLSPYSTSIKNNSLRL